MESKMLVNSNHPSTSNRILAAAGPLLWVAISYIDPGKWATTVEGGARHGFDIALLMLVVNCAAIFWQYLSARIAIATGKDLAQIFREEYDDGMYTLLRIQAEASMAVLDFTTVLGTAYGLSAVFGVNLYICVFLISIDVCLFPYLATHFENPRAKLLSIYVASCILVSYVCGLVICQPETSVTISGMYSNLRGEDSFLIMALLGGNIMPHNFFLHSSIVQRAVGQTSSSKGSVVQDHLVAITFVFSCILLGNIMLMNWAVLVFYSDSSGSPTLSAALSMLDQVSGSSVTSVSLLFILYMSNLLIPLPRSHGNRLISQDLFKSDISCWLQRAAIRLFALIIAMYCVSSSGVDSLFQLLIFSQVFVALLLPSSVLPLYKVASSKSVMGVQRIYRYPQLLAKVLLSGMLAVKVTFLYEMVFGESVWANSLRLNMGGSTYYVLVVSAFICFGLVLGLAITPLKSDAPRVNSREMAREENTCIVESPGSSVQYEEEKVVEEETELSFDENRTVFPEIVLESERNPHLATIQENIPDSAFPDSSINEPEASPAVSEATLPESSEEVKTESLVASSLSGEPKNILESSLQFESDLQNEKEDVGGTWEPEESNKYIHENNQSENLNFEGPGSFKSLSGKLDDVGSGAGSLSRLAGLGRAARRQLTTTLDEFWGQLFDFHGQITQDARAKKLDSLLGIVSKPDSKSSVAPTKVETLSKESSGYFSSPVARGSDSFKTSSLYNPSMQQLGQNNIGSPMWLNQMQQLDAYMRNSNQSGLDSSERRYNSVRHIPSSYDSYDNQPNTIHGCDMASYLNRIAKENGSDSMKGQVDSLTRMSGNSNAVDPHSRFSGQTSQNGLRMTRPPGFHNVPISRNVSLKSGKPVMELLAAEQVDYANNSTNEKKYYSMPDISGRYVPNRDSSLSGNRMDYSSGYGAGQSINRQLREQTLTTVSAWGDSGLGLNELSPSKICSDAYSVQFDSRPGSSFWSRQPYERFGVADKSSLSVTATPVDMEPKILRSLRICVNKLLRLEGSDWLFRQNDGVDEDLIARVAAREKFVYEVETRASALKPDEVDHLKIMSVPNCGEACVWRVDLVTSFGVWCIHRILELSLMESRPELWGKYTYVLNRLQGIVDLAFSKPRSSVAPCFCLLLPAGYQQKSSQAAPNDGLPPTPKLGRGKFTTAPMLLEMIKDVETAISSRKGRTGTAAGDVAFPKGKENLASVLKRYKRRLSNRPVGPQDSGHGSRKIASPPPQSL